MKNYFDKIYCINLDSRPDRWNQCLEEFKKINIENLVERFPAVQLSPGIAGCTKSHYEIIKLCKKNNFKNVLILEDDVNFINLDFFGTLDKTLSQLKLKNLSYDMLYLGGNLLQDSTRNFRIDSNLSKLSYCKTTHAFAINESIYNIFLDSFKDIDWLDGNNWHHGNPNRYNIDMWYVKNIQQLGNVYGVYPCLAEQRESYSDLLNTNSYVPMRETWNSLLKNIKND